MLCREQGPLSQRRIDAINRAFDILDTNRNDVIELEEIYDRYNAKEHPEVRTGCTALLLSLNLPIRCEHHESE